MRRDELKAALEANAAKMRKLQEQARELAEEKRRIHLQLKRLDLLGLVGVVDGVYLSFEQADGPRGKAALAAHEFSQLQNRVRETGAKLSGAAELAAAQAARQEAEIEAALPSRLRVAMQRVEAEIQGLRLGIFTPEVQARTEALFEQRRRLRGLVKNEWTADSLRDAINAIVSDPDA